MCSEEFDELRRQMQKTEIDLKKEVLNPVIYSFEFADFSALYYIFWLRRNLKTYHYLSFLKILFTLLAVLLCQVLLSVDMLM